MRSQEAFAKAQERVQEERPAVAEVHAFSWEDYMAELREKHAGKEDMFCRGVEAMQRSERRSKKRHARNKQRYFVWQSGEGGAWHDEDDGAPH
jgi:hypothetical protein